MFVAIIFCRLGEKSKSISSLASHVSVQFPFPVFFVALNLPHSPSIVDSIHVEKYVSKYSVFTTFRIQVVYRRTLSGISFSIPCSSLKSVACLDFTFFGPQVV